MSRSNYDKPFYVDVGTSIVAIRCASNHDVIMRYSIVVPQHTLKLAEDVCDRMNHEAEIGRPRRNCDRFGSYAEARAEWWKTEVLPRVEGVVSGTEKPFDEWLFSPAEDTKGENNGRK